LPGGPFFQTAPYKRIQIPIHQIVSKRCHFLYTVSVDCYMLAKPDSKIHLIYNVQIREVHNWQNRPQMDLHLLVDGGRISTEGFANQAR